MKNVIIPENICIEIASTKLGKKCPSCFQYETQNLCIIERERGIEREREKERERERERERIETV